MRTVSMAITTRQSFSLVSSSLRDWISGCVLFLALAPQSLSAQAPDNSPSFTLASSRNFNTRERPSITLIYRGVETLDVRVYKVSDSFAFFEKLRDPHHLGGAQTIVPQGRTWLERIAQWKSDRRGDVRRFARGQLSVEYRRVRREQGGGAAGVEGGGGCS